MDIVVGTAGHIDHGKTALVKALTGIDADRLPEEKQRGITIDLGFAELDIGDVKIGFVDVPGHERFVKNMLAGAGGIDLVLLVIAADEGVMPQTREHFEICRLLDLKSGIVVLTKSDLVDVEMLELVKIEAAELVEGSFLENAPVVPVSSRTGEGIDELRSELGIIAGNIQERSNVRIAILPIDRSFTVKGHGAVVTGTLHSGEISIGDELELLPDGLPARVRGVQSHGRFTVQGSAGKRVAVNLGGIDHSEVKRGMVLTERGVLSASQIFDAAIEVVKSAKRPIRSRQRARIHLGTAEILGRIYVLNESGEIERGERDFVQIRLEQPVPAVFGDRIIIRSYSPQDTIAGGGVLDPHPSKHRKKQLAETRVRLVRLAEHDISKAEVLTAFIAGSDRAGVTFGGLQARTAWRADVLKSALKEAVAKGTMVDAGGAYLGPRVFEMLRLASIEIIGDHHRKDPLSKGISRETLRDKAFSGISVQVFETVVKDLESAGKISTQGDSIALAGRSQPLSAAESTEQDRLQSVLDRAGLEIPKLEALLADSNLKPAHARKVLQLLIDSGIVVKVSDEFFFARKNLDRLIANLRTYARGTDRTIDVPRFKEIAGVSRKYAIPLLEYLDREKITVRSGESRIIK